MKAQTAPLRDLVARLRRSIVALAMVLLTVLATGWVVNAVPASAASRHRHHHHHKRHARRRASDARRCANADTLIFGASNSTLRASVVCLIDDTRAAHGLPGLGTSSRLNSAAQNWTNSMVASGNFSEGNPGARISAVGFDWSAVGENIATGFETPRTVVAAWMASQGHCENILNPDYAVVGTGVNRSPVRGWTTRSGTWTQDFGLAMGARPRSNNWAPADHCPY